MIFHRNRFKRWLRSYSLQWMSKKFCRVYLLNGNHNLQVFHQQRSVEKRGTNLLMLSFFTQRRSSCISEKSQKVVKIPWSELGDYPILWHIMKIYSSFSFDKFILTLGYWYESMIKYSSLIFIGFALSTWGLITPISLLNKLKEFSEILLIFLIGCAIMLPGRRYCVRKFFGFSPEKY